MKEERCFIDSKSDEPLTSLSIYRIIIKIVHNTLWPIGVIVS